MRFMELMSNSNSNYEIEADFLPKQQKGSKSRREEEETLETSTKKHDKGREEFRDWSGLLDDILQLILHSLLLSSWRSSFSGVCRAWRAAACTKKEIIASQPPFLMIPSFLSHKNELYEWQHPSFRVLSPASVGTNAFSFSSRCFLGPSMPLSNRLTRAKCVYSSNGYLIDVDPTTNRPVLTDPFTGEEHWLFPSLPRRCRSELCKGRCCYGISVLLGSPLSRSRILIFCDESVLWTCVAGQHQWSHHVITLADFDQSPNGFVVAGDRLYCVTWAADLLVFDFNSNTPIQFVDKGHCGLPKQFTDYLPPPRGAKREHPPPRFPWYGPFIAESLGELFLVRCHPFKHPSVFSLFKIEVYKLQHWKWVRMRRLDNAALFLDIEGSAMYCTNPARWGGKENHVYLTGPPCDGSPCDGWIVFSLDDPVDLILFDKPRKSYARWPRPLWMLPNSCY